MSKIKKREDGRYTVTCMFKGKRKFFYGKTRSEAAAKKDLFLDQIRLAPNFDSSITLGEWMDEYLRDAKERVARATYVSYERISRVHIVPSLGEYSLSELQTPMIRNFLNDKLENLSTRTVEYIHVILKAALSMAVNDGIIFRNPMSGIKKPHVLHGDKKTLTAVQLQKLLSIIDNAEYFRLIYLTANTGLRREEVLGLRIHDIDIKRHTLSVNQTVHYDSKETYITPTTKNESSRRTISLDVITMKYVNKQILVSNKKKLSLHHADYDLLFSNADGLPLFPPHVSAKLKEYLLRAGLPKDITFHSLRHTHATLLLQEGVNFKAIQARLGHSSFAVTMDTYSHVTPDIEDDLVQAIPRIMKVVNT